MENLKITAPDGYEIDREKSTLDEIVFKPVKKALPKSWEELNTIGGCYVNEDSRIIETPHHQASQNHQNIFKTKKQAAASIALAQLSQLRDVYRDGWEPNWDDDSFKFCIKPTDYRIIYSADYNTFLSFQSRAIAEEFLDNFYDLIEEARPLLS